jgi:hypothetical protein
MPRVGLEPTNPAFDSEDSSRLRPRGRCDGPSSVVTVVKLEKRGEIGRTFYVFGHRRMEAKCLLDNLKGNSHLKDKGRNRRI